jgi:DNA-binding protein HU-beta
VNKAQLVEALSTRLGEDKKRTAATVEALLDTVYRTVQKGEKVALTGFGVFEKRDRAARTARNPATGEKVRVKKTSVPAFRAGQEFKNVVNGSKKLPKVAPAKAAANGAATKTTAKSAPAQATTAKATPARATRSTTAKAAPAKATKTAAAKTLASKSAPAKASKSTAAKTLASKSAPAKAAKTAAKSTAKATPAKKTTAKAAPRKTAAKTTA